MKRYWETFTALSPILSTHNSISLYLSQSQQTPEMAIGGGGATMGSQKVRMVSPGFIMYPGWCQILKWPLKWPRYSARKYVLNIRLSCFSFYPFKGAHIF